MLLEERYKIFQKHTYLIFSEHVTRNKQFLRVTEILLTIELHFCHSILRVGSNTLACLRVQLLIKMNQHDETV